MSNWNTLPKIKLGVYPTPFYRLENISRIYNKDIWIKRDDLCGVALGGNKVRKLEYLLADAQKQGCDTVFTTGGAQSNHAMLTAACAARLGMRCTLILKKRGVTDHKGNLILDDIFNAQVEFMDTDSYEDIYAEMRKRCEVLASEGHKGYIIPVGGSTALGAVGYAECVREMAEQAKESGIEISHVASATGSGGTTADMDSRFRMIYHVGAGYAIPNAEDTPYIEELARQEGILLDPVYTGKAWTKFLMLVKEGYFDGQEHIAFVHTGGAAALFAMDLG